MRRTLFVTGIGTDVGKTVVSAILAEALGADYWKPIACGPSDREQVAAWIGEGRHRCHPEAYTMKLAASPHKAARLAGVSLDASRLAMPQGSVPLVIEGVGGLLCPFDGSSLLLDHCAPWPMEWIVVSRHYLGSINHTLMTIECMARRNLSVVGLVFNGDRDPDTEQIIVEQTGCPILGRLAQEPAITADVIRRYATQWQSQPYIQALQTARKSRNAFGIPTANVG